MGQEELESSTFAVSERHSNQLNYWPITVFWFQAISSADTRLHQKEIFRQSHLGDRFRENGFLYKGGDPAAPSGTATLLWLNPNHQFHRRRRPLALNYRLWVKSTLMVWQAVCTRPGNVFTAAFWSAITSDSSFMSSSCRGQSELRWLLRISFALQHCDPLLPPL